MQHTLKRQSPAGGPGDVQNTQGVNSFFIQRHNQRRQEICHSCYYSRAVQDRQRRFVCVFLGEKIRATSPACQWWPGVRYE